MSQDIGCISEKDEAQPRSYTDLFEPVSPYVPPPSVHVEGMIIEAPPSVLPASAEEKNDEQPDELELSTEWQAILQDPSFMPDQSVRGVGTYKFSNGWRVLSLFKDNQLQCAAHELVIKLKMPIANWSIAKCNADESKRLRSAGKSNLKENFEFKVVPLGQILQSVPHLAVNSQSTGSAHPASCSTAAGTLKPHTTTVTATGSELPATAAVVSKSQATAAALSASGNQQSSGQQVSSSTETATPTSRVTGVGQQVVNSNSSLVSCLQSSTAAEKPQSSAAAEKPQSSAAAEKRLSSTAAEKPLSSTAAEKPTPPSLTSAPSVSVNSSVYSYCDVTAGTPRSAAAQTSGDTAASAPAARPPATSSPSVIFVKETLSTSRLFCNVTHL